MWTRNAAAQSIGRLRQAGARRMIRRQNEIGERPSGAVRGAVSRCFHQITIRYSINIKLEDAMRARVNLKLLLCVTALWGAGCLLSSASAATFVYVGNADSQDVSILELKSSGDLTSVETVAVPGPTKPGGSLPLAVSPDKKRLYVGLRNEPYSAVTFAIDARTGKLTLVGPCPLADSIAYVVHHTVA